MSDFYDEMAGVAQELLEEFKQGTVTVTRVIKTPAANGWEQPTEVPHVFTLSATVRRVEQQYVNGESIVGTEDEIVMPTKAIDDTGTLVPFTPEIGDEFSIDGRIRVAKDIQPKPAAGTPVAFLVFIEN